MTPSSDITDRQRRILARLVAEYIEQGEPVSSAWLADNSGLGLSSATVRNILARLEEQGLLRQPHTSAGRVPTDSGYRLYVDRLLGSRKRTRPSADVEARLRRAGTVGDVLESVSHELSRASHQVGFAMSTSPALRLRHVDFVSLDSRRVLVIVVATGGQITHKVVETHEEPNPVLLAQGASYINQEFAGLTLAEARTAVLERLRKEHVLYDALLAHALQLAQSGLDEVAPDETLHVQGASSLLGELSDRDDAVTFDTLRVLFQMMEEKSRLVELLTKYIDGQGLTIVIGSEHLLPDLRPFSLIASMFHDGDRAGAVGVIGPTRMRYQHAITVVEGVSDVVSRMLEGQ
jgi:heat-inducible transcriptional repressor